MKMENNRRFKLPFGALVPYGEFAGRSAELQSAKKWTPKLRTAGLTARAIKLKQPDAPVFVVADDPQEPMIGQLPFGFAPINPQRFSIFNEYGETAPLAARMGMWCYEHRHLDDLILVGVPPKQVLVLLTFMADRYELPVVLNALSAHRHGFEMGPETRASNFERISWMKDETEEFWDQVEAMRERSSPVSVRSPELTWRTIDGAGLLANGCANDR